MSEPLDFASKLDRSPSFTRELMNYGNRRAGEFLEAVAFEAAWRSRELDAVMGSFADEAEVELALPFTERASYRGKQEIPNFVEEYLADNLHLDPTNIGWRETE